MLPDVNSNRVSSSYKNRFHLSYIDRFVYLIFLHCMVPGIENHMGQLKGWGRREFGETIQFFLFMCATLTDFFFSMFLFHIFFFL